MPEPSALDDNAAATSAEIADVASDDAHGAATVKAVFAVLCYQGYAFAILGVGAPFIATSFGLDQSGIARMYAWISLNSLGALILSRMADRVGRRRIVLISLIITPVCSLGAALSTRASWFIAFEMFVYAATGAIFASSLVMVAESLPIAYRAKGQGWANLATGTGGGLCVILAPLFAYFGISWRWLLVIPAGGIVAVPAIARMIPESRRWERAAATGAAAMSHYYDVFGPRLRWRTIPLMIATLLGEISGVAVASWVYYHAVTVVGLSPARGSVVLLVGGTISVAGLALGAWMSERFGRVHSIVVLGFAGMAGVLGYYWGPPPAFAFPTLWLLITYAWFATTGRGIIVAANSAVTELFPTALRGTILGWLTLCVTFSAVGAQVAIAVLARPLGGLSNVVGWLGLLTIPSVMIWGLFIEETRGLSLEAAAGEESPATS